MTDEHWFDVFSKAASHATTRRGVARSAAVLVPSLLFSGEAGVATNKKKGGKKQGGGGKGRKKGRGKKEKGTKESDTKGNGTQVNPDQGTGAEHPDLMGPPEPVVDDCVDLSPDWPESPELVREWQNNCREQREQCPADYCIYIHNWDAPEDSSAVMCCASPKTCCHDGCVDFQTDNDHCGDCRTKCGAGEVCRAGSCVCEGPGCPQACHDANCLPGQVCVTSLGYLCDDQTSSDCQCGCWPGYYYCQHPQAGWRCQSYPC